ncbi:sialic acid-binding Ig-like lectin 14 isoform X1 [Bufo gargarizans]|uniref:sialic acid-binding Ig-like lectin 14 isoform X1 n=1 Tax=Bufo gargarizans TaxID=30331 RepID=UPI001CF5F71C|nr:sialic acid-binding Ig-like lectin 14 isoform X1 [Bufo gargarizans]
MWFHLSIVLLLLWKSILCAELPGYSIFVNSSFSVQESLCVTIPCTFIASSRSGFRNSRGFWLKSPILPFQVVATNVKSRSVLKQNFHLTGNTDNGDCTLTITDARREDAGTYYFRFEDSINNSINYNYGSSLVNVKVTDLSDKPKISPVGRITAGEEVTLDCTNPGRCSGKSPLITWEGKDEISGVTQRYMERNEDGTMTHHASLTFIPWIEHNQSLLTCKVTFESNVTTSRSIRLMVQASPDQSIVCPVCRCMDSIFIAGMVAGNIIILTLITVGSYFFLKKHTEKKKLGNKPNGGEQREQGTESTYQDLIGQKDDIYYNIRTQ